MIGRFAQDWQEWGLLTAWWNLRFELGFNLGGFTSAKRDYGSAPDGAWVDMRSARR